MSPCDCDAAASKCCILPARQHVWAYENKLDDQNCSVLQAWSHHHFIITFTFHPPYSNSICPNYLHYGILSFCVWRQVSLFVKYYAVIFSSLSNILFFYFYQSWFSKIIFYHPFSPTHLIVGISPGSDPWGTPQVAAFQPEYDTFILSLLSC